MRLQINNWAKYNPRSDYKSAPWLRFQCDTYRSKKLFGLSPDQKWLWVFLLQIAGESDERGIIDAPLEYLIQFSGCEKTRILETLEVFKTKGLIGDTNVSRTSDVREPFVERSLRTNETNETNEQGSRNSPPPSPLALVDLWNAKKADCHAKVNVALFRRGTPRWKAAEARLKESPDLAFWADVVERIASSPFCQGENDRAWKADFEFLVRPDTAAKVLEGKYDPKGPRVARQIKVITGANPHELD